jgi:hypothetical protein
LAQLADVPLAGQLPTEEPSTNISIELNPTLSVAVAVIVTIWLEDGLGGECDTETAGGEVSPEPPPPTSFSVIVRSSAAKLDHEVV